VRQPSPAEIVDVWRIDLDASAELRDRLWPILAEDERDRARRFHLARDAHRFVVAHGALRTIVAACLGCAPADVAFVTGSHGKPEVAGGDLRFNLSHSGALALCAVSAGARVGVDVECLRGDVATDEVARAFFSVAENAALSALPATLRSAAFFACWTRKEAYVKARGDGVSARLESFDVLVPGTAAVTLRTRPDGAEAARWRVVDLDAGAGYVGALAVEAPEARLAWRAWRP